MANPNHPRETLPVRDEVRMFVRHSDGSSLVIPEQTDEISQLSFKLQIPYGTAETELLGVTNEFLSKKENRHLTFIALQRYLGHESGHEMQYNGSIPSFAFGYLGQVNIGKPTGPDTGRMVIPASYAREIMNNSPAIDSLDRSLAFRAFQTVELGGRQVA